MRRVAPAILCAVLLTACGLAPPAAEPALDPAYVRQALLFLQQGLR